MDNQTQQDWIDDDRRAALRRPVHVEVQVESGGILWGGYLRDLSAVGAACVMTACLDDCPLRGQDAVLLWLSDSVSVAARVVWRREQELGLVFEIDEPPPPLLN
ncbi:MAG: PilZ domain-containing protein [Alphaproteobacteria bacterium]|nr:PilZ domain-containing protein [Alphaproteobacteria bacterium]